MGKIKWIDPYYIFKLIYSNISLQVWLRTTKFTRGLYKCKAVCRLDYRKIALITKKMIIYLRQLQTLNKMNNKKLQRILVTTISFLVAPHFIRISLKNIEYIHFRSHQFE